MKTVHIVLGVAAVAGLAWYVRNKRMNAGQITTSQSTQSITQVVTDRIPMPYSEVDATRIVNLPGALLPTTSGNTGIMPPVLMKGSTPFPTFAPVKEPIYKQTNLQGFTLN